MGEFLRRLSFKPRSREAVRSVPSPFVLVVDDQEKILMEGASINLAPGESKSEDSPIKEFGVKPESDSLTLNIQWGDGYRLNALWGNINQGSLDGEKEFDFTFTPQAVESRDASTYIKGGDMFFNPGKTVLNGNGWAIKYRPKDS